MIATSIIALDLTHATIAVASVLAIMGLALDLYLQVRPGSTRTGGKRARRTTVVDLEGIEDTLVARRMLTAAYANCAAGRH